jgi:hypothetical protein
MGRSQHLAVDGEGLAIDLQSLGIALFQIEDLGAAASPRPAAAKTSTISRHARFSSASHCRRVRPSMNSMATKT